MKIYKNYFVIWKPSINFNLNLKPERKMTKVITGRVRFSYAHVWEPKAIQEGQEAKYSVAILIPKKDKVTIAKIQAAIEEAAEAGKGKWNGKIPPNLKKPLRDGDTERPDDENYAGHYFMNASSSNRPGIVDESTDPILDKEEFYSGCYGRASVNFFAYNTSGNKGIGVGLNNLQKLADGPRLSGGSSAAEDFGGNDNDLL